MKQATQRALAAINARFYAQSAEQFSATRGRPWPGLSRALASTPALGGDAHGSVLDIGCGNGRALPVLREHFGSGLRYLGVDASEPLLAIARERWAGPQVQLERWDFLAPPLPDALPADRYALCLLLGVLHCVPGEDARAELLRSAGTRLALGGTLIATIWRYDRDPRFAERCIARERFPQVAPGLDPDDLDPGDQLLTFGAGDGPVRYAHFPSPEEVERLVARSGLPLRARFSADGAGQQLNEYLVLGAGEPGSS
jgi:SAM-dependent methyltransferase